MSLKRVVEVGSIFLSEHLFIQLYCVRANTILHHRDCRQHPGYVTATGRNSAFTGSLRHSSRRPTLLDCTQA